MQQLKYWNGSSWINAIVVATGIQGANGTNGTYGANGTQGATRLQGTTGSPKVASNGSKVQRFK